NGSEHGHLRHTANALRDRGLITISKRGGVWRAEMTKDGRFYLDHGHHPDDPRVATDQLPKPSPPNPKPHTAPPANREPEKRCEVASPATQRGGARTPTQADATSSRGSSVPKRGPVDQLMQSLQDAVDRRILVPASEEGRYRHLAGFAKRFGRIPDG